MTGRPLRVWVLQTGEPMPIPGSTGRPMRGVLLAEELASRGHKVTLWTSDFEHMQHRHFFGESRRLTAAPNLDVQTVFSRGYKSNVSPQRLVDHAEMARELSRLLERQGEVPDVAFVGFPPIETAWAMSRWLRRRDVPFVLDVKDQWPDVLARALPRPTQALARGLLAPYYLMARATLHSATALASISEPFLEWTLERAGRTLSDGPHGVFPLASRPARCTDEDLIAARMRWDQLGVRDDGVFRVAFVGTLSTAFDFEPLLSATALTDMQFVICGTGSQQGQIESMMDGRPNVIFPGWIGQAEAQVLAERSSVSLAPYKRLPDFRLSLPNKYFDALANGLPTVTSLDGELGRTLQMTNSGEVYDPRTPDGLKTVLSRLAESPAAVREMQSACIRLARDEFSSDTVYGRLATLLEDLPASLG